MALSLGFILQLIPAVEHSFYSQIFKLFEVILSLDWLGSIDCHLVGIIVNKREACRFGNPGAVSKKLKLGQFLKIPTKRLCFNPLILMHGGIYKPETKSIQETFTIKFAHTKKLYYSLYRCVPHKCRRIPFR